MQDRSSRFNGGPASWGSSTKVRNSGVEKLITMDVDFGVVEAINCEEEDVMMSLKQDSELRPKKKKKQDSEERRKP